MYSLFLTIALHGFFYALAEIQVGVYCDLLSLSHYDVLPHSVNENSDAHDNRKHKPRVCADRLLSAFVIKTYILLKKIIVQKSLSKTRPAFLLLFHLYSKLYTN